MTLNYFLLLLLTEFIVSSIIATTFYVLFERREHKRQRILDERLHSHIDKVDNHIVEMKAYISTMETHILEANKK